MLNIIKNMRKLMFESHQRHTLHKNPFNLAQEPKFNYAPVYGPVYGMIKKSSEYDLSFDRILRKYTKIALSVISKISDRISKKVKICIAIVAIALIVDRLIYYYVLQHCKKAKKDSDSDSSYSDSSDNDNSERSDKITLHKLLKNNCLDISSARTDEDLESNVAFIKTVEDKSAEVNVASKASEDVKPEVILDAEEAIIASNT